MRNIQNIKYYILLVSAGMLCLITSFSLADESSSLSHSESVSFCDTLKNIGTLRDTPDSLWIQRVQILGRFQYQYAYIEGSGSDKKSFSYDSDEFRRVWIGARVDFLKSIRVQGQWDIVDDDDRPKGGSRTFDTQIWELFTTVNINSLLQIDNDNTFTAGYGRRILHMGGEWHNSSTKIKTVERSILNGNP